MHESGRDKLYITRLPFIELNEFTVAGFLYGFKKVRKQITDQLSCSHFTTQLLIFSLVYMYPFSLVCCMLYVRTRLECVHAHYAIISARLL